MFQQRTPPVTEDFPYMTAAGLCYYLPAALAYLQSDSATGDWDFAHGLMCSLSCQAGITGVRGGVLTRIREIAEYVDCHWGNLTSVKEIFWISI